MAFGLWSAQAGQENQKGGQSKDLTAFLIAEKELSSTKPILSVNLFELTKRSCEIIAVRVLPSEQAQTT